MKPLWRFRSSTPVPREKWVHILCSDTDCPPMSHRDRCHYLSVRQPSVINQARKIHIGCHGSRPYIVARGAGRQVLKYLRSCATLYLRFGAKIKYALTARIGFVNHDYCRHHIPSLHPSLVPVRRLLRRNQSNTDVVGSTSSMTWALHSEETILS